MSLATTPKQYGPYHSELATAKPYSPRSRVPVELLAAQYNVELPAPEDLPRSYTSVRVWLTRRIATMNGRNKRVWQDLKKDQARLAYVRKQNKARVNTYRAGHAAASVSAH